MDPIIGFLSLIPTTSVAYPQRPSGVDQPAADGQPAAEAPALALMPTPSLHSRTSSISTDTSVAIPSQRFLKLSPVHWGQHLGEHKGDWYVVSAVQHMPSR